MHGIIWGLACVFTQCVKHPNDPDQYRTGYDIMQVNRIARTGANKGSFSPQTTRDWNALPDSLISSVEVAEECVAKFISLVTACVGAYFLLLAHFVDGDFFLLLFQPSFQTVVNPKTKESI